MSDFLLSNPLAYGVSLAIVSFVWQGTLIALAAAVALAIARRAAANVRYTIACLGLLGMAVTPVVTTIRGLRSMDGSPLAAAPIRNGAIVEGLVPPSGLEGTTAATGAVTGPATPSLEAWLPLILFAWIFGVLILTARLIRGWVVVERIRRRAVRLTSGAFHEAAARIATELGIARAVQVAQSTMVDVPTVMGWLRPTVLLPLSALSGLSLSQLEAILLHEMAHIRRHDYAVNMLQNFVETLLFYHPAVWWMSRQVRVEREHCADDLAAALCGDRVAYAGALASLEEARQATLAFGVAANGTVLPRIRRVLGRPPATRRPQFSAAFLMMATMALAIAGYGLGSAPLDSLAAQSTPALVEVPAAIEVPAVAEVLPRLEAPVRLAIPIPVEPLPDGEIQVTSTATASPEAQVHAAEADYREAKIRRNVAVLERLLADAFFETTQNGVTRNRAQALELARTFQVDSLDAVAVEVRVIGDAAFVTGRQTEVIGATTDRMLFTRVWKRSPSGVWTLVASSQFRDPRMTGPQIVTESITIQGQPPGAPAVVEATTVRPTPQQVGVVVSPPTKITDVKPVYPAIARAAGITGVVILEAIIDVNGNVADLQVRRSVPLLDQAAIDAVRQWRYTPTLSNGVPVAVRMVTTVNFTLPRPASSPAVAPAAQAMPAPPGPVRVGGDISAPTKIADAKPPYPAIARAAGIRGVVFLEAIIARDGTVRDVRVTRSAGVLDQAAIDAVRQWRYTPTLLAGEPVEVVMSVTVNFTLPAETGPGGGQ